ncbi:hypothetical protein [Streptomyces avicenniae]|uniref:hypothetical protein n=1 Tax=Streptomyces avicenniae TaxID=500153 RepID=UPI00069C7C96|nr:hypothetical protein [Streptomyces avicenniae]
MGDLPLARREYAVRLADFTAGLRAVTDVLDPSAGWFAAFGRRAAVDLGDWLEGRTLPPWDAVADLLQDLAVLRGPLESERAGRALRGLYEAAVRVEDAAPDGREALEERAAELDRAERRVRLRQRQLAVAEEEALRAGHAGDAERYAALRLWSQDDEERVVARRAEVRARLAALGGPAGSTATGTGFRPPLPLPAPADAPEPARKARRARGGARFAGVQPEPGAAGAAPTPPPPARGARAIPDPAPAPAAAPVAPVQATGDDTPAATPLPGGSRFAGALRESRAERKARAERLTAEERRAALAAAGQLHRLREDGHSGAAHVLLSEAAQGPAGRLPVLAAELERLGMASDVATLLWEAASLPPGPLAAAAEALAAAGREADCGRLLRQGAARPAPEAGSIAAELWSAGRAGEAVTLLSALVRARPAEEAARAAEGAPDVVVPLLLDAARSVSPHHHYAVNSELRRAGVA